MVRVWHGLVVLLGVWAVTQPLLSTPAEAQLDPFFYVYTCPELYPIVAEGVIKAIINETRNAASLLRLHFHDCFVQGCDASVLLDATATLASEKTALPNLNSLRGFEIIDGMKASLERVCPNVVSCADIVAVSAFFSVVLSGGPFWLVPLGRRDSFTAATNVTVLAEIPSPFDPIANLVAKFAHQNLTITDMVALSGGHTIGLARCAPIIPRIYNFNGSGEPDPTINVTLLATLKKRCPVGGDGNVTNDLDIQTPTIFDNLYFQNLLESNGIFGSDQELVTASNATDALVKTYATDMSQFFSDFSISITKMGNLNPLTGTAGEIRKNCHVRNTVKDIVVEEERIATRVEETGGERELLEQIIMKAIQSIAAKQRQMNLEKLVEEFEETVSGTHSSM